MKKIIAIAVAGAFVAPALHAAEVSVSGEVEYIYRSIDGADNELTHNDFALEVQGVEEVGDYTFTGTLSFIEDEDGGINAIDADAFNEDGNIGNGIDVGADSSRFIENDGTNLEIAGPFGELHLGDVSGAMDAVGDYTDVAPTGGSFYGDGDDHAIRYVFPTFIEGLELNYSYSPKAINVGTEASVEGDARGVSLEYTFGPVSVYGARDNVGDADQNEATAYGIKYSANGLTVAVETATEDHGADVLGLSGIVQQDGFTTDVGDQDDTPDTAEADLDADGVAVTYKLDDILVGYESQVVEEGEITRLGSQVMFIEYNMGSNVDIYFANIERDDDADNAAMRRDETRVGVEFQF